MKTWILIALASVAVTQDKPVVVEGTVVDAQTKVPLANVAVAVRYTKPPDGGNIMTAANAQGAVTLTGADGRFRLEETKTVPFKLYCGLEGYVKQTGSRVFELKAGESASGVTLSLDPESQISGQVLDEDTGKPVSGLAVSLVEEGVYPAGGATTDAEGRFTIRSLAPGEYKLAVTASAKPRLKPAAKTPAGAVLAYPYTWFPGVGEVSGAMAVRVPAGAKLSGYDFRLRKQPVLSVRGEVEMDGASGPMQFMLFESRDRGATTWTVGTLDKPGPFELTGLAPGSYLLQASAINKRQAERRRASVTITLVGKPLEDVRLNLLPGVRVTGDVRTYGHKEAKTDPLWLEKRDKPLQIGLMPHERPLMGGDLPGPAGEQGQFVIEGVSMEPYRVWAPDLPAGFVVRSLLYNGAEADPSWFELNTAAVTHHLTVSIGRVDNSLAGVVKRGDQPVDQAAVMAVREGLIDPRRRPDFLYAKTDASGRYSIAPVPPGIYRVLGLNGQKATFGARQRFLNGEGVKVEVGPSTQAVVDLELSGAPSALAAAPAQRQ